MRKISKKLIYSFSLALLLGCSVNSADEELALTGSVSGSEEAQAGDERCATMKVHAAKIKENPGLLKKMEAIEEHTKRFVQSRGNTKGGKPGSGGGGGGGTTDPVSGIITIPVVVNVIYKTTAQNISDDQIRSQIEVLNRDFQANNTDLNLTTAFNDVKSNMAYQFTLVKVNRKYSPKSVWGTRDAMKSAASGGIDATEPANNLNIWVCNIGGGILGYAQFPGGAASTDGVVVGPEYFGNEAYMPEGSSAFLAAPYDKGRTATHEVGHWMNLRHIWGDATCGNDLVNDTPPHNGPNGGCPESNHLSTCGKDIIEMTMNYMDYTYDACMYMFSEGQKTRSRAVFASGGPRASFAARIQ